MPTSMPMPAHAVDGSSGIGRQRSTPAIAVAIHIKINAAALLRTTRSAIHALPPGTHGPSGAYAAQIRRGIRSLPPACQRLGDTIHPLTIQEHHDE